MTEFKVGDVVEIIGSTIIEDEQFMGRMLTIARIKIEKYSHSKKTYYFEGKPMYPRRDGEDGCEYFAWGKEMKLIKRGDINWREALGRVTPLQQE